MKPVNFSKCCLFVIAFASLGIGGCASLEEYASIFQSQEVILKEEVSQQLQKDLDSLKVAAASGDVSAQFLLGNMFMTGTIPATLRDQIKDKFGIVLDDADFVHRDDSEAGRLFKLAAEQEHSEAQARLAMMYFEKRIDHPEPYQEGIKWAQKAVKTKNDLAEVLLCIAYMEGNGIKKSYDQAFNYLKKADLSNIDKNLPEHMVIMDAVYNLGDAFLKGKVVKKSTSRAVQIFEKLDDMNYLMATRTLAQIYHGGYGVKRNDVKSLHYGLKAESAGASDLALQNASILYSNTKLRNNTYSSSVDMVKRDLRKIDASGNTEASMLLFYLLRVDDSHFITQEEMELLVRASADNRDAKHILNLLHKELKQLEAQANKGNVDKMLSLSYFYSQIGSYGVPEPMKAVHFVKKAVDQGSPEAMMILASFYDQGTVLPKDPQMVVSLINKAASLGYPEAVQWINNYNQQLAQYQMEQQRRQQMLKLRQQQAVQEALRDISRSIEQSSRRTVYTNCFGFSCISTSY